MLVHCTNQEHKRIPREVTDPHTKRTIKGDVDDPSVMCFVNVDGEHVTPRKCLCRAWRPGKEDRKIALYEKHEKFDVISAALLKAQGGGWLQDTIPSQEFRKLMFAIHGKANPRCPIEDAHEPIDPNVTR